MNFIQLGGGGAVCRCIVLSSYASAPHLFLSRRRRLHAHRDVCAWCEAASTFSQYIFSVLPGNPLLARFPSPLSPRTSSRLFPLSGSPAHESLLVLAPLSALRDLLTTRQTRHTHTQHTRPLSFSFFSDSGIPMANYTYIDADQLVALMDEPDSTQKLAIIDCRDSDREQGFLVGSQHVPTLTATEDTYKKLATALWEEKKTVVVFHCALSQVRGPKGANRFATAQKALGYSLPSVCVLRGGFDGFYEMYANTRMDLMYV